MLTLDDVVDYVHKLKDLRDKFVLEIMSTDDENRRNELAQEVHKITNYCAWIDNELKLSDRIYKCNECGLTIDRDVNAAINLKQYAFNYINGLNMLCRK